MPNPKRVAAGKRNRQLRGPWSEASLQRLREAARANQPWLASTGPRSQRGKQIVSKNAVRLPVPSATLRLACATLETLRELRKSRCRD